MQTHNDCYPSLQSAESVSSGHSSSGSAPSIGPELSDLLFSSWEWPSCPYNPSSHVQCGFDTPIVLTHKALRSQPLHSPPAPQFTFTEELMFINHDHEHLIRQHSQQSPLSCRLRSPSHCAQETDLIQPSNTHQFKYVNELSVGHTAEDEEEELSPFDWISRHESLLASPFSEDSDSDDGLAPSPFSSPESNSESVPKDEGGGISAYHQPLYFSSPLSSACCEPRFHDIDEYPHLDLQQEQSDARLQSLSFPLPPLSSSSHLLSELDLYDAADYHHDLHLQSASTHSSLCDSLHSNKPSMTVPDSPHCRAMDLPPLEDEGDANPTFGLGLHAMEPSSSSALLPSFTFGRHQPHVSPLLPDVSQRTTWLSFPGEDTDDDLIPSELASKTYIPDPAIAIPTTPPSRNLLIWDPTTTSGLPAGLPSFDGTGRTSHYSDGNDLPFFRSPSPGDDFDVDPDLLAELAKKDAEKGEEVQKLCDLRERATIAAAVAARSCNRDKEGAQREVEKVKEKMREVTALLRLKLKVEEKAKNMDEISKSTAVDGDSRSQQTPSVIANTSASSSNSTHKLPTTSKRVSLPTLKSVTDILSEDPSSSSAVSAPPTLTSTSSPSPHRRSSKPKITSMDQLVASMVFHRQQEALRRSPNRSRTWSPSMVPSTTSASKNKTWVQTSPTSPLRQVILPEDLDESEENIGKDCKEKNDNPLQLSPLGLVLHGSPESFYAQLDVTSSHPSTCAS